MASCAQTSAKKGKLWSRMISAWPRWIQLIWFEIFCFKYLTFYGGDIAGGSSAGFLNTCFLTSLTHRFFDLRHRDLPRTAWLQLTWWWNGWNGMTGWPVKDGNWDGDLTSSQPNSGRLRTPEKKIKSQSIPSIHPRPFSVKAQMLLPVSTLEVFGAAKDVRNFLANNLGGYRGIWKGHTTKIIWQK